MIRRLAVLLCFVAAACTLAFAPLPIPRSQTKKTAASGDAVLLPMVGNEGMGKVVNVEFKIHKGGMVEFEIHGLHGKECEQLNQEWIERLGGELISTERTEEYYQEEVKIEDTLVDHVEIDSSASSGSEWDGQSTW